MIEGSDALAFAAAIERLVRQRDGITLVKLGGSALDEAEAANHCLRAVAVLHQLQVPLMLVHGGGKAIDRAMQAAGLTPHKVAGRRYTDAATLDVVVNVLQEMTRTLTEQLRQRGTAAVCGWELTPYPVQGELLRIRTEGGSVVDLGWVGTVSTVDHHPLLRLIEKGQVPVLPCVAAYAGSPNGWLNVNADTLAARLAGILEVERAIFLTDTPGVLRDPADPTTLISELTAEQARQLIVEGVIRDGMIPKVEACLDALAAGARTSVILDGRRPLALLELFLHDDWTGTRFRP